MMMPDTPNLAPSPWYFWEHYSGEPNAFVVGPGNFETVAEVRQGSDDVAGNPKDHARLIAASPTMLTALRDVRVFVQDCLDQHPDRASIGNLMSARDTIDKALMEAVSHE